MGGHQALELQKHHVYTTGEQKVDQDHADRRQLGRDSDEIEVGLCASLILCYGIAHGEDQGFAECREGQASYIVDTQDRGADKHQVPDEVFLAREARIALFQLAHVLVNEVRIEEHAQLGCGDEKARDGPPDLGKKPEKILGRVDKIISGDEPKVHSDGQQEGDRGGSPGNGWQPPVGISNVLHIACVIGFRLRSSTNSSEFHSEGLRTAVSRRCERSTEPGREV